MNFNPFWVGLWIPPTMPQLIPMNGFCIQPLQPIQAETAKETESSPEVDIERCPNTRRTWTAQEDNQLLKVIREYQAKTKTKRVPYRLIARRFKGRTSKQIRERYLNKLDPEIVTTAFTEEEDEEICQYYLNQGPRWKGLSLLLKGRTPTMLKNRFNTKLKNKIPGLKKARERALRQSQKQQASIPGDLNNQ